MSVGTPSQAPIPTPPSEPPYPWRVGLALAALALVLGGVFFGATQLIKTSATSGQESLAPTQTAIAQAVATVAAAPAQTPAAGAIAAPQATTAVRATSAPTVAVGPQVAATPAPTAASAAATSAPTAPAASQSTVAPAAEPTVAATPEPTLFEPTITPVDPGVAAEVDAAYLHYFDVRAQALFNNDPTGLDAVADGPSLAGLKQTIADQKAEGKALETHVVHDIGIAHFEGDPDDVVAVADSYKDLSFWVDATTHEPLPGQTIPSSADEAPEVNVYYKLRNIDGVWKVIEGHRNAGYVL